MFDFDQLDKTIHEKSKLSIMSLLAGRAEWSYQELKTELDMSDGNLITHLRKLVEAEYVSETKEDTGGGRPRTTYAMTKQGKAAFKSYIRALEQIVRLNKPG
jgi:DNA-binding PadR family transcriptional regulator